MKDVIELARALIKIDTAGRNESAAMALLVAPLREAGFEIIEVPWQAGRSNFVARWHGGGRLALCAHIDTVPFTATDWTMDPLGAEVRAGRIYGRGSSDMKCGAAAMVTAAIAAADPGAEDRAFSVVLTSGEETGCEGAQAVASTGLLPQDPILIIGEATGNGVRFGHKGATWLRATAHGHAAHGSRPDLGKNAIDALIDGVRAVRHLPHRPPHPTLGMRTVNIGTINGGEQTNIVPSHAEMTIDVRTTPGSDADDIQVALEKSEPVIVERFLRLSPVWTDPSSDIAKLVVRVVANVVGWRGKPTSVSYFTDAAILAGVQPNAFIIGPGDLDQPHTANESCSISRVLEAEAVYRALLLALNR